MIVFPDDVCSIVFYISLPTLIPCLHVYKHLIHNTIIIYRYKMTDAGVPMGTYQVGTFKVKVCTHRPLVSKDYMAFQ